MMYINIYILKLKLFCMGVFIPGTLIFKGFVELQGILHVYCKF